MGWRRPRGGFMLKECVVKQRVLQPEVRHDPEVGEDVRPPHPLPRPRNCNNIPFDGAQDAKSGKPTVSYLELMGENQEFTTPEKTRVKSHPKQKSEDIYDEISEGSMISGGRPGETAPVLAPIYDTPYDHMRWFKRRLWPLPSRPKARGAKVARTAVLRPKPYDPIDHRDVDKDGYLRPRDLIISLQNRIAHRRLE